VIGNEGIDEKDGHLFAWSPRPKSRRAIGDGSHETLTRRRPAMEQTVAHSLYLDRQGVHRSGELRPGQDSVGLRMGVQDLIKQRTDVWARRLHASPRVPSKVEQGFAHSS
jgi:hypothetical protein